MANYYLFTGIVSSSDVIKDLLDEDNSILEDLSIISISEFDKFSDVQNYINTLLRKSSINLIILIDSNKSILFVYKSSYKMDYIKKVLLPILEKPYNLLTGDYFVFEKIQDLRVLNNLNSKVFFN